MKKILFLLLFTIASYGQAEYEKIAITQNTQDNTAGRLLVQDVTTGEVRWILKSILDNKFNQPTGNATQYLDGAGNPTTFPVLSQSDRVITEVRNSTGATMTKGTVVYLNGATGGKPNIEKAQANAEATSSGTFGVVQSDINNNSNGYVVVIGTVLGLNTSAYTAGQILWLSPTTAGGYTTTKPVAPNHAVYVGIVTLASTQGTIEVKIQNGYELEEIHDVLITSKTDNDALIYESSLGLWKNKQITKAMIGLANVDNTSDANKPISTATQTALNLKENTANKNTANGYAGLGSDGKLISSQLPAITITDTFVVGSQSAMLALTAETGDVAVRTDINKSFILKGTSAGTLADWQELLTPTSAVTSVFGRNGAVTANSGDYTTAQVTETTNKKYQTDNQSLYNDATSSIQTQLNAKEPSISAPGTVGSYWRGNKTWATLDTSVIPENGALFFTNARAKTAVTGDSGTLNYLSKFTTSGTIGNSLIYDNGTNIGIGTTSPTQKLDVSGNTNISGYLLVGSSTYLNSGNSLYFDSGVSNDYGIRKSGSSLIFTTGGNFSFLNGNVGIGTTAPAAKLHVSGGDSVFGSSNLTRILGASQIIDFTNSAQDTYVAGRINGLSLKFYTNSGSGIDINSSGNVGIGTTSPAAKLDIVSSEVVTTKQNGSYTISIANGATTEVIALETNATYLGHVTYSSDPTRFKSIVVGVGQLGGSIQGSLMAVNDTAGAQFLITCIGQSLRITNAVGSTQTFKIALTKIGVN